MIRVLILAAVGYWMSGQVCAQHLLAQDTLSGEFYSVDLRKGEATLVGGTGVSLTQYTGLAADSQGTIYAVSQHSHFTHSELHEVDPATGQLTYLLDIDRRGISGIAFGPGDVLYAVVDLYYPAGTSPHHLMTIDTLTGVTTVIGRIAPAPNGTIAMDFDGATMYVFDIVRGLMTVDLNTGLGTDVDPSFIGSTDNSKSICFGDDGTL